MGLNSSPRIERMTEKKIKECSKISKIPKEPL